ncbi:MAG TPA: hypothetical protein VGN16_09310 [Acidobacteriaceae bacterium]|jgi:hypothetical protein
MHAIPNIMGLVWSRFTEEDAAGMPFATSVLRMHGKVDIFKATMPESGNPIFAVYDRRQGSHAKYPRFLIGTAGNAARVWEFEGWDDGDPVYGEWLPDKTKSGARNKITDVVLH